MSYGYEMTQNGPVPVANYYSVISVVPSGTGSAVVWTSTFDPTGDGAEATVIGVYEAGLGALAKRFGG